VKLLEEKEAKFEDVKDLESKEGEKQVQVDSPLVGEGPTTSGRPDLLQKRVKVVESTPASVMQKNWAPHYAADPTWSAKWRVTQSGGEWPQGIQLRGEERQFMYLQHRIVVPEGLADEVVHKWHCNPLGHAGCEEDVRPH
jgi:hypothetical protein